MTTTLTTSDATFTNPLTPAPTTDPPSLRAILITADPAPTSPAASLGLRAAGALFERGIITRRLDLNRLPAEGLLGRLPSDLVDAALARVAEADLIIIAAGARRSAVDASLTAFFDLLPDNILEGRAALTIAVADSPSDAPTLDIALRIPPARLGAVLTARGIATSTREADSPETNTTLDRAVNESLILTAALAEARAIGATPTPTAAVA